MARLLITSGGQPEQTIDLGTEVVTVGREAGNTVVLGGESKASRRHCQISPVAGGWEVTDLQSTNGTRVNGQAVKRQRLMPGDAIEVGLSKMRFDDPEAAAAREATPSVCYLEYTAGSHRGERIALTAPRTTFGRRETNTVVLDDRMASGHHAEVVRDLNGYTIRDLGSTNGTLVNGESVTETLLVHGARVRVGGARLVFKDPTMKDVEVALAGIDEDDGGWGMMADLDLAKAGRGGAGGLLAGVLFLAVVAGGGFWISTHTAEGAKADPDAGNWISDGRFESPEAVWWTVDEGSPASTERTAAGGVKGSPALVVRHDPTKGSGLGVARYSVDLEMTSSGAYKVSATARKDGPGRGDLAIQWVRFANAKSGSTGVTQSARIASVGAGWAPVSAVVRRPAWAEAGRLVVIVGPESTVRLDDVRFEPSEAGPSGGGKASVGGDADAYLSATGTVALARTATVLAVGGAPWAMTADRRLVGGPSGFVADDVPALASDGGAVEVTGRLLDEKGEGVPGKIRWAKGPDGLVATVSVAGAAAVGVSVDVPLAHLEDGVGVLGSSDSRKLSAEPGASLDGARKALLGDAKGRANRPSTLMAVAPGGGAEGLRIETLVADDAGLLRVRAWAAGASGGVRFVTSFDGERAQAREHLLAAERLAETSKGRAVVALRRVAQEFPFQEDVRRDSLDLAQKIEDGARTELKDLGDAIDRFRFLGSEETLAEAERRAGALSKQFPTESSSHLALEQSVAANVTLVREARWKFDADRAAPEIKYLARLAGLLEQEKGFEVEAAAYYEAILRRFEALAAAAAGSGSDVVQQVEDARKRRDALLALPEVRAAFPALPARPPK